MFCLGAVLMGLLFPGGRDWGGVNRFIGSCQLAKFLNVQEAFFLLRIILSNPSGYSIIGDKAGRFNSLN